MVQVYESQNGLILSCFMLTAIRSVLRKGGKRRYKTAAARFSQRPKSCQSRDNKIPHAGQWRFMTQSAGRETCTKSMPCAELTPLARRLQNAFAWLNPRHALTAFNFHYHYYDD